MGINRHTYRVDRCALRSGFTLIELLAVIAVMVILMALTIPAFDNLGRGTAVRTAATQVASALTLARQEAILSGANTYILFPDGSSSLYSGYTDHRNKAYRSYAIYSEKDGYIRNWTYLPKGVVFIPNHSSYGGNSTVHNVIRDSVNVFTADKTTQDLPFPENGGPVRTLDGLMFSPDGAIGDPDPVSPQLAGTDAEIYIAEGTIDPTGGGSITPQFRSFDDSSLYMIKMYQLTGRHRILDLRMF